MPQVLFSQLKIEITMSILYQDLPVVYDTGEILEDKTDWRKLKLKSFAVSKVMSGTENYLLKRSVRMETCGSSLHFACTQRGEKRLIRADFCMDRLCPACQKRRSLVVFHQVKDVCLSLQSEFKTTQYLLLTLTIPNIPIEELKSAMSTMNKAWTKMAKRSEFKKAVWGWFKALEVTCSSRDEKNSSYHPHFHILLAVPNNYFKGRNYITQPRWLELWQESMKMPEITQVDVRRVKANSKKEGSTAIESAAAEVGKYATKPSNYITKFQDDYIANRLVVNDLAVALRGARLTSFGGRMKEHYQKLELEDVESDSVDLVHVSGDNQLVDAVMVQVFKWNLGVRRYVN
jgi:plasmid rolling circle replication initiator protein Rep